MDTQSADTVTTVQLDDFPPVVVIDYTITDDGVSFVDAAAPNPRWVHTDSHGHQHQWALTDGKSMHKPEALPTLTRLVRHVDCDGSCGDWDCEGYDVTEWFCQLCGDQVEPGVQTVSVPLRTAPAVHMLSVRGWPIGDSASYQFSVEHGNHAAVLRRGVVEITGRARVVGDVTWRSWSSDPQLTIEFMPAA